VSNKPSHRNSSSAKVRAASGGGRSSTTWLWVGLVALVVVVGVVAVLVGRSSDSGSSSGGSASPSGGTVVPNGDLEYGSIDVLGTKLADAPASGTGAADTALGETIPTIKGTSFDGSQMAIAPDGQPQIIIVAAHWCPHCQAEVPRLQSWLDQNGMPTDVELVTIATANDSTRVNFPAGPWLRKEGWSVPTMIDDKESNAGQALGVTGYPAFIVVDKDGKVVFRTSGEITMPQWESLLEAARTGTAPTS
jgi:cytochrome c biogenesis protein CcmG, thiol:disulfide interchange protein DsbE